MSRFLTPPSDHGFVLLEALLAMSLIAGLGVTAFDAYQGLVLRHGKAQEQRRQLRQEFDQHETQILKKGPISESARMPRRNGALPHAHRPTSKGGR